MWLSYNDSEVESFHPICKKALNLALDKLSLSDKYEIVHHEYTGTLEMDFVIKNKLTGRYLCVIEVKRTPKDVSSARYQFQAMNYVQMNGKRTEEPFYVVTNLENSYVFRYTSNRPRVVQQILEPGLVSLGKFSDYTKEEFIEKYSEYIAEYIKVNIIDENYKYQNTLKDFQDHMKIVSNHEKDWKSSLVILLYEYIRGSFNAIGRDEFNNDIRKFSSNIQAICREAIKVNFEEIFNQENYKYNNTYNDIDNLLLEAMYETGNKNINGDYIANLLHEIASEGKEHEGEVPTDLELSKFLSILAKKLSKNTDDNFIVSDPAAGSGNLITSSIDIFDLQPKQIKVNDYNEKLLELLSLRVGLNNPNTISKNNTPEISIENIVELESVYFDDVDTVLLNPPFVSGIYSKNRKAELFERISKLTQQKPKTQVGQISLEAPFIELVTTLAQENTILACIIPITHLTARGPEARTFRKFLLNDFGLKLIFTYPEKGLFESVTKKTCIVVGKVRKSEEKINIISAFSSLQDIDISNFEKKLELVSLDETFTSIVPGIEGTSLLRDDLREQVRDGWREITAENKKASVFIEDKLSNHEFLIKIKNLPKSIARSKRGPSGNIGISDLLFLSSENEILEKDGLVIKNALRQTKNINQMHISEGDSVMVDISSLDDDDILKFIDEYYSLEIKQGKQIKKEKSKEEIYEILHKENNWILAGNLVLLPRGVRNLGKVFYYEGEIRVSTNLLCISYKNPENAKIAATWASTVFYQLICEFNAKDQEGLRKIEVTPYKKTLFPNISKLTQDQKDKILEEFDEIEFLNLKNAAPRKIDYIWAEVLFGKDAEEILQEATSLVSFLATQRDPSI